MSWFALFCVSEVPVEALNSILKESFLGHDEGGYWLANEDWTTADLELRESLADYPVTHIPSAFIGESLKSVARELANAPEEVFVDLEYFAVVDSRSAEDETILLCHTLESGNVDGIRSAPKDSIRRLGCQGINQVWTDLVEELKYQRESKGIDYIP